MFSKPPKPTTKILPHPMEIITAGVAENYRHQLPNKEAKDKYC